MIISPEVTKLQFEDLRIKDNLNYIIIGFTNRRNADYEQDSIIG